MRGLFEGSALRAVIGASVIIAGVGVAAGPSLAHDPAHTDIEGVWMAYATVRSQSTS